MTPVRSVLVVVDAQVGVLANLWESARVVENIERLVDEARAAGAPVVWVQHSDNEELKFGSEAWKLAPNFAPAAKETVLHKKFNSSFARTDLDSRLRTMNVGRIVLAGAATNWCIRATAYAALDRGYSLTLVSDAHSTESMKSRDGRVVPAEAIVSDTNAVFQWLSAPGVTTEAKASSEIRF